MADRLSVAHQRFVLTVGGKTYTGWHAADRPDSDLRTSRYTPDASRGDVAVVGVAAEGGTLTLTKRYDEAEYQRLKAAKGREASVNGRFVDVDGRSMGRGDSYTGVLVGTSPSNLDKNSADKAVMVVRVETDGEVG